MLTNNTIIAILREAGILLHHSIDLAQIRQVEMNHRSYATQELGEFKRDLTEAAHRLRFLLTDIYHPADTLFDYLAEQENPVLAFTRQQEGLVAVMITPGPSPKCSVLQTSGNTAYELTPEFVSQLVHDDQGSINLLSIVAYHTPFSPATEEEGTPNPLQRLIRLLGTERREIAYILVYAVLVGVVSLILPVGIQTTIELISGGVVFSSVYVMIGLVLVGVIVAGALQLVQMSMVEYLQRRVFVKAAFDFAYRMPRLQLETLQGQYPPELVNRFFEVMTVQKGLPKLLIDLSAAAVSILVGLLLISLYHPFFVLFGVVLLTVLTLLFLITGPRGLRSSILESKYKFKVVHWLEELGRSMSTFKLAGNSDLPIQQTDYNVNSYLKNRKGHFQVLMTQFSFIIFFKAAVTGGLLIAGTMLVVNRQITLGQFVASEIVIILILNAVEKIIMNLDVVYDLLTAVDKIGQVTDLSIERTGGLDFPSRQSPGLHVQVGNLSYPKGGGLLTSINFNLEPGSVVCVAGPGASGKSTLCNIISGFYSGYEGAVLLDGYSMRDLDLTHLRERIGRNGRHEDLFEGTLLDNLTVGNRTVTTEFVLRAADQVGLTPELARLPDGLSTRVVSSGHGLPASLIQKMLLVRAIAKQPRLLILDDFGTGLTRPEKLSLIDSVAGTSRRWTVLMVSNDPLVMASCDRVLVLRDGAVYKEGTFAEISKDAWVQTLIG
ncbi:MAG TPA: ABC transporter ATP-binding protein [Cyclobacteriaceae bacterium]|nr:ABC transporter ATP-binding protein [Cyclobacteriaceae bacterium]